MYKYLDNYNFIKDTRKHIEKYILNNIQQSLLLNNIFVKIDLIAASFRTFIYFSESDNAYIFPYNIIVDSKSDISNPKKIKQLAIKELNSLLSLENVNTVKDTKKGIVTHKIHSKEHEIDYIIKITIILKSKNNSISLLTHTRDNFKETYCFSPVSNSKNIMQKILKIKENNLLDQYKSWFIDEVNNWENTDLTDFEIVVKLINKNS